MRLLARYRCPLRGPARQGPAAGSRPSLIDPFRPKIEEWVNRSRGNVRAGICHRKLRAMGFVGSERTTRRAVAHAKKNYRHGNRRVFRPWITEPGMWCQWDWAEGPLLGGRKMSLFCAWLSWSRFRVIIPARDCKQETLITCLDRCMRILGGVPSYWLTDNERTITIDHVANPGSAPPPDGGLRRPLRHDLCHL